jgi:hypothetical protein
MAKKEKRMSEDLAGPEAISPAADVAADDSRNSESALSGNVDRAVRMIQYLTDNATISRDAAPAIIAGLNAHRDKLETL